MAQRIHRLEIESFLVSKGVGKINLDQSLARLRAVCDAWNDDMSQNVLVDVRERTFELTHAEVRELVQIFSKTGLGKHNKVAVVYRHRESFDAPVFMAFLAGSMALNVKAFDDYENALKWLATSETPVADVEHD